MHENRAEIGKECAGHPGCGFRARPAQCPDDRWSSRHISGGDPLLRQLIMHSSVEYVWNSSLLLRFLFPSVLYTPYKIRFLLAEVSQKTMARCPGERRARQYFIILFSLQTNLEIAQMLPYPGSALSLSLFVASGVHLRFLNVWREECVVYKTCLWLLSTRDTRPSSGLHYHFMASGLNFHRDSP